MGNNLLAEDQQARAAVPNCSLFRQFFEEKVDQLLARSRLVEMAEGEYPVQQSQPESEFFLMLESEIKLAVSSSTAQEKILHIITPRQTFAEVLVYLGKPRYAEGVEALSRE